MKKFYEKLIRFFQDDAIEYLPINFCEGKTEFELLLYLKKGTISMQSGQMIVNELLTRLIEKNYKKNEIVKLKKSGKKIVRKITRENDKHN